MILNENMCELNFINFILKNQQRNIFTDWLEMAFILMENKSKKCNFALSNYIYVYDF